MWTREELKSKAKRIFRLCYWKMLVAALIFTLVGGGRDGIAFSVNRRSSRNRTSRGSGYLFMSFDTYDSLLMGLLVIVVIGIVLWIFLFHPLQVGGQRFFVVTHYHEEAMFSELGYAFSHSYLNVVKTMLLRGVYTFLWSLLLIIPGIVKMYEYRMIPYILAENPGISTREAFAMSKWMMDGNKWAAFVLDLSFLGWEILSAVTAGILGIFYVSPYRYMTNTELYITLKETTVSSSGQGIQWNMN